MKTDLTYVDRLYDFPGRWEVPSRCGLKIARGRERHVVLATELDADNPGTSVTSFCAELATRLCREFDLDPARLVFIEHCPDRGSKLAVYAETFDRVRLDWDGTRFKNPDWTRISKEEADALLAGD